MENIKQIMIESIDNFVKELNPKSLERLRDAMKLLNCEWGLTPDEREIPTEENILGTIFVIADSMREQILTDEMDGIYVPSRYCHECEGISLECTWSEKYDDKDNRFKPVAKTKLYLRVL